MDEYRIMNELVEFGRALEAEVSADTQVNEPFAITPQEWMQQVRHTLDKLRAAELERIQTYHQSRH